MTLTGGDAERFEVAANVDPDSVRDARAPASIGAAAATARDHAHRLGRRSSHDVEQEPARAATSIAAGFFVDAGTVNVTSLWKRVTWTWSPSALAPALVFGFDAKSKRRALGPALCTHVTCVALRVDVELDASVLAAVDV